MRLIDSNIFILAAKRDAPPFALEVFAEPCAYSTITRIEVPGFHRLTENEKADIQELLDGGDEIALTDSVAACAIQLRQARRMGLGDAVIAATALEHNPLVTQNFRDFRPIAELELYPE